MHGHLELDLVLLTLVTLSYPSKHKPTENSLSPFTVVVDQNTTPWRKIPLAITSVLKSSQPRWTSMLPRLVWECFLYQLPGDFLLTSICNRCGSEHENTHCGNQQLPIFIEEMQKRSSQVSFLHYRYILQFTVAIRAKRKGWIDWTKIVKVCLNATSSTNPAKILPEYSSDELGTIVSHSRYQTLILWSRISAIGKQGGYRTRHLSSGVLQRPSKICTYALGQHLSLHLNSFPENK